jgi:hypothetical protein
MSERDASNDEPDGHEPTAALGPGTREEGKRDESRPMQFQNPASAITSIRGSRRDVAMNAECAVRQADLFVPIPGT